MAKAAVAFVEFDGDFSQIQAGAAAQAGGIENTFNASFKKIAGFAATTFGAVKVGKFLAGAVSSAEQVNQEVETTIGLFGAAGDSVVKWSETTDTSLGLTEQASLGMVDRLGAMLKGFGLAGSAAKSMSLELVKSSVDVGTFLGKDPTTILQAYQTGLKGAARGLGLYGIDASVAAQKSEALTLGIAGTTSSWTAAQKAAIFYQLILKGTAQEVGTFAARSGDLTVEQKQLGAVMGQLRIEVGQGLLPVVTNLFGAFDAGFKAIGPGGDEAVAKIVAISAAGLLAVGSTLAIGKGLELVRTAIVGVGGVDPILEQTATTLGAQAAAATAAADALQVEALAAADAATSGGAVDLVASSAATALGEQAAAAVAAAAALDLEAAAAADAAVASEGLQFTPLGIAATIAGVAIAGLTAITTLFGGSQKDAGKSTNDFIDSLLQEGLTANSVAGSLTAKFLAAHTDLVPILDKAGVSTETLALAVEGNGKAYDDVKAKLDAYQEAQLKANVVSGETRHAHDVLSAADLRQQSAEDKLVDAVGSVTKFVDQNRSSLKERAAAQAASTTATKQLADAEVNARTAADNLAIADNDLTTAIINNVDRLRSQQEGLDGVLASSVSIQQGTFQVAAAQKAYNDALNKFGPVSTKTTQAHLALEAAQLSQNQSLLSGVDGAEKYAQSIGGVADAQKAYDDAAKAAATGKGSQAAQAAAADALTVAHQKEISTLTALAGLTSGPLHAALVGYINQLDTTPAFKATQAEAALIVKRNEQRAALQQLAAETSGPVHDAIAAYLTQLHNVPANKTTTITTPGITVATKLTHNYRGELADVPLTRKTTFNLDATLALHTLALLDAAVRAINPTVSIVAVNRAEGGRGSTGVPGAAHGLVTSTPMLALIGEDPGTTPEVVSPVSLMAQTFRNELHRAGGSGANGATIDASINIAGSVHGVDDLNAWADERDRKLEQLLKAG